MWDQQGWDGNRWYNLKCAVDRDKLFHSSCSELMVRGTFLIYLYLYAILNLKESLLYVKRTFLSSTSGTLGPGLLFGVCGGWMEGGQQQPHSAILSWLLWAPLLSSECCRNASGLTLSLVSVGVMVPAETTYGKLRGHSITDSSMIWFNVTALFCGSTSSSTDKVKHNLNFYLVLCFVL